MKIDIFAHIIPPGFKEILFKKTFPQKETLSYFPTLFDLDQRFRIMDRHPNIVQVLAVSSAAVSVDNLATSAEAGELARMINDEMAE